MAKKNIASVLKIRSLADGPRDYPLKDGSSVYLPPKGKPVHWAEIAEDVFSEVLARAEEKGLIEVNRNESITAQSEAVSEVTA